MAHADDLQARVERLGVLVESLTDAGEHEAAGRLLGHLRRMDAKTSEPRAAELDVARAKVAELYAQLRRARATVRIGEIADEMRRAQACGDQAKSFRLLREAHELRDAEGAS